MSQNSVVVPNTGTLTGLAMVNAVNAAIDTVQSNLSGNADPGAVGAYRLWADTTTGLLKIRNAANSGWITLGTLADLGIQSGIQTSCVAGGTADALTGSFTPVITALPSTGLRLRVRAALANATTTPTFTPNSGTVTAYTIVKGSNQALVAGDIAGAGMWLDLDWDNTLTKWVLLNPATGVSATVTDATTSVKGKVQLADNTAALALADALRALTPSTMAALLNVVAGGAPIYSCRAWGSIDTLQRTGTYTQSGTTVTVTMTAHGGTVGQKVGVTIGSGTAVTGSYVITTASANSYTYTAGTSLTTSGNITQNSRIKAGGNITSIAYNAVGDYTIAFTTAMDDVNYAVQGFCTSVGSGSTSLQIGLHSTAGVPTLKATTSVRVYMYDNNTSTAQNSGDVSISIFR